MKKSILHFVAILLIFLGCCLVLTSCKAKLPPPQEPIVINQEKVTTVTEKETISLPINNNTVIPVIASKTNNRVFDSLVNTKVDEILKKLNYQNQSGNNSLEVKYNALLKQLEIQSKTGQTANKDTSKSDKERIEVPVIKQVPYPVIQPLTLLQKLLIALGVGTLVFFGFKLFFFIKSKVTWV